MKTTPASLVFGAHISLSLFVDQQMAVIYMCTRLMNNIIQAYTPLYLIESLGLSKVQ